MPKQFYKHIRLPHELISLERIFVPPPRRGGFGEEKKFSQDNNRKRLAGNVTSINKFYSEREGERLLADDLGNVEVRVAFRGPHLAKFIDKYGLDVYRVVEGRGENEIVYGKISNHKRQGETLSRFEKLKNDISIYKNTGKLKSYFDFIREIKPLEIKEIVEPSLYKVMVNDVSSEYNIDVSFGGDKESSQLKITQLEQDYPDKFYAKVNTQNLHYCRLSATYEQVEQIVKKFAEISKIERSPVYMMETSVIKKPAKDITVINPPNNLNPAFVFDTDVNINHFALLGAVDDVLLNDGTDLMHGTAVASLVVCGGRLTDSGVIQQDNRIIAVKVSGNDFMKLDQIIQETVEKYAPLYPMIIANLSVNATQIGYSRKKDINKLTILLDVLAKEYECLFVISAGNLFNPNWTPSMRASCLRIGYPNYFKEKYTRISPPADSMNNISVGSVTYQASADSMISLKNPAMHTRGNMDDFPFVKPDLVHYDSNHRSDFSCEENGVFMADVDSSTLTSMPGTSFAAPLVTHDLIMLHNKYPDLNVNSIKGLIIHSADNNIGLEIRSKKIRERMIGFGLPNAEKVIYSNSHSSTIVIEDEILVGKEKTVRFPIPACIGGSSRKRVRITKTLVYNPPVNAKNMKVYNPVHVFSQLSRPDDYIVESGTTRALYGGAHMKSNVKKYPPVEKSTTQHTGDFWSLRIVCENKDEAFVPPTYKQKYSVILTIEDLMEEDGVNLHEDILNMIEVETHVHLPVHIVS